MGTLENRIAAAEAKLKQLRNEQLKNDSRKRALATQRKRQDATRRKVLVGAVMLAQVDSGEWPEADFRAVMDQALTRPEDRALFDLEPAASTPSGQPTVTP